MDINHTSRSASPTRDKCAQAFRDSIPEAFSGKSPADAAVRYCLNLPGGLVRSEFSYNACKASGLTEEDSLAFGTGVEYLHTASLIFDDLPSMDNAETRRGAPCVHHAFSEDSAILSSLAFINRGYSLIWQSMQSQNEERRRRAGAYLDHCLSLQGILGGQSRDVNMPKHANATDILRISYDKTVSLLRLALVMPALISGETKVHDLERVSLYLGLAYQVVDDLKDVCGSSSEHGKTVRQDSLNGRPNIVVHEGAEKSIKRVKHYMRKQNISLRKWISAHLEWSFLSDLEKRFDTQINTLNASQIRKKTTHIA